MLWHPLTLPQGNKNISLTLSGRSFFIFLLISASRVSFKQWSTSQSDAPCSQLRLFRQDFAKQDLRCIFRRRKALAKWQKVLRQATPSFIENASFLSSVVGSIDPRQFPRRHRNRHSLWVVDLFNAKFEED